MKKTKGEILLIDLSLSSSLNFEPHTLVAEKASSLYFELDLGLFDRLPFSISDEGQWQSLAFGMNHFVEKLLNPFLSKTEGVILFRGPADLSKVFPWDGETEEYAIFLKEHSFTQPNTLHQKLFCQEVCSKFFQELLALLPESIPVHLHFERSSNFEELPLLSDEFFSSFEVNITPPFEYHDKSLLGLYLPSPFQEGWQSVISIAEELKQRKIPFKGISEFLLTQKWDNLTHLIVVPETVSSQGKRKLGGFVAAEGEIIYVKDSLDDPDIPPLLETFLPSCPASLHRKAR